MHVSPPELCEQEGIGNGFPNATNNVSIRTKSTVIPMCFGFEEDALKSVAKRVNAHS